jgi:putative lipoic acid-binding regulatory protein
MKPALSYKDRGEIVDTQERPSVEHLPAVELLESTHDFPGPYTFKVIGRVENGFIARVVAAVRDELHGQADPPFSVRQTAGGKHVAVTLEPIVQTAEQVLALYRRLRRTVGLVMLF